MDQNKNIENRLEIITDAVQLLIDAEFDKVDGVPTPDSALDQAGLKDGKQIVMEFIHHGELGLAIEHLVYMIEETDISISNALRNQILEIASGMNMEDIESRLT